MAKDFEKILDGYKNFREKYTNSEQSLMQHLSCHGQNPDTAIIACCDSRVDPSIIFQCEPGELFVIRNLAAIVPPYEKDNKHHGTSAAIEYAVKNLNIKNLILLGHSQCGGMASLFDKKDENDFIANWISILNLKFDETYCTDDYAKLSLQKSYDNCLTFPWIQEKVASHDLQIHMWFFDIASCQIFHCKNNHDNWTILN